ncbi:MAG TPA: response regulator transcription factor [Micromonosporaceae bacterium]
MTLTVVAIADSALVRAGIAAVVAPPADLELVATAASAAEGDPLIEHIRPHVALIDHDLGDSDGLAYAARLRHAWPSLGVVLIAPCDDALLIRALEAGISAYVPRSAPVDAVLAAARHAAAAPGSFAATGLADALARRQKRSGVLSPREAEVLRLMTEGWTAGRISSELRVSESTVRTYLARLYDKLGVRTRGEALVAAERLGLATDR